MAKIKEKKTLNKNMLMILAIPLLVAIGVIAGSYFMPGNKAIVSGNETQEKEIPEVTVPLDEFLLNLEPSNNVNHYIRLEVSLSSKKEDGEAIIKGNLDKIRDILIYRVSRLTVDDVYNDESGTQKLKEVLKTAINEEFGESLIHDVYVTNIVVQ